MIFQLIRSVFFGALLPYIAFAQPATSEINFSYFTGIPGQKVFFASELHYWDSTAFPMQDKGDGNYIISMEEPWVHALQYKFVVNGTWFQDTKNPNAISDGVGGYNSVYKATQFNDDPLILSRSPKVPVWSKKDLIINDGTKNLRSVSVLSPPSELFKKNRSVSLVLFNDGQDFLDRTGIDNLIANLSLDNSMPLIVGVFVSPQDREREYAPGEGSKAYADFLADSVVPQVEASLGLTFPKERRLIAGISLGGLGSLVVASLRPDAFGIVSSESGSYWWDNQNFLKSLPTTLSHSVKIYADVGTYETSDMIESNHVLRNILESNGFHFEYREYPSTHDWIAWRNRLKEILTFAFRL